MPQSNSNLQSYAKLPAAKNNSPKIFSPASLHSLTQISQIPQIPRFCTPGVKSHRSSPHPLSLMLTQIQRDSTKIICANLWKFVAYKRH